MSWDNVEFFTEPEFTCRCGCDDAPMDFEFLRVLDEIRREFGQPMTISSGYRCANHRVEARKEKPGTGAHSTGKACDVLTAGGDAFKLLEIVAAKPEITGLGVNQRGPWGERFLHLDTVGAGALPRPTLWSY